MDFVKTLYINKFMEINDVLSVFASGDYVQLQFDNLNDFNKYFPKFSNILYDYAHQIKSLYCPCSGSIFEDTVMILSTLEDNLDIPINNIMINSIYKDDIKQLYDFYIDDIKDNSLIISVIGNSFIDNVNFLNDLIKQNFKGFNLVISYDLFNINIINNTEKLLLKNCGYLIATEKQKKIINEYPFSFEEFNGDVIVL